MYRVEKEKKCKSSKKHRDTVLNKNILGIVSIKK